MRVGPAVRAVGVGVGGDRLRHVRFGGLEQSSNGECVVQVVGIKASGPENPRRLDTTSGEEVAKESRDITGISTQEALGAQVAGGLVLGGAMRGARATLRATISTAVVTAAELADTRSVNHLEGKVV